MSRVHISLASLALIALGAGCDVDGDGWESPEDCDDRKDLTAVDAVGLFPRSTTWIGYRKDILLRRYMLEFIQLFAPHITPDQIEKARLVRSQAEMDKLFEEAELPVRGGCPDKVTAAA